MPVKISVVIPTRHRDDLLSLCLDRLAPGRQTLPVGDYEVIVTDDGSERTAQEMIRARYPWAKWSPGPRKGPAANRNSGARQASGEWVVFCDDDCVPESGWLAGYAAAIRLDIHVLEGRTTCRAGIHSPLEVSPHNLTGGWLWSCNMAVQKSLFLEMGGFDEGYPHAAMEDIDFRERLRDAGIAFEFVPAATVDHPPRRAASGRRQGVLHQCEVRYRIKRGEPIRFIPYLIYRARFRFKGIIQHRLSWDTFVALGSMLEELAVVAVNFHKWTRESQAEFASRPPARPAKRQSVESPA